MPLVYENNLLLNSVGRKVYDLQYALLNLIYWLVLGNDPEKTIFDYPTQQAVFAIQKVAKIKVDGIVGPNTINAINNNLVPPNNQEYGYISTKDTGRVININLNLDLLMIVDDGMLKYTFNTSTGSNKKYTIHNPPPLYKKQEGKTYDAITPCGKFTIIRETYGHNSGPVGVIISPKFFTFMFAIHGLLPENYDSANPNKYYNYCPSVNSSHGCVRLSNEAIYWIWNYHIDEILLQSNYNYFYPIITEKHYNKIIPLHTPLWIYNKNTVFDN